MSRYETGHIRPGWPALQALLGLYDANSAQRSEAAQLWEDASEPATQVVTPAGSSKAFRAYLRAEAEAEYERMLTPLAIPGLLQTAGYARAINSSGRQFHTSDRTERYVSARMSRKARLTEPSPLKLHAVIDEAVIRRVVGSPEVMREQLDHLIEMGMRANVTIQVMPFSAGAYGTMEGAFMIIGYPRDEDPPAVYLEHPGGGAWVENESDVGRFSAMFDEVTNLALTSADSAELIAGEVKDLE